MHQVSWHLNIDSLLPHQRLPVVPLWVHFLMISLTYRPNINHTLALIPLKRRCSVKYSKMTQDKFGSCNKSIHGSICYILVVFYYHIGYYYIMKSYTRYRNIGKKFKKNNTMHYTNWTRHCLSIIIVYIFIQCHYTLYALEWAKSLHLINQTQIINSLTEYNSFNSLSDYLSFYACIFSWT